MAKDDQHNFLIERMDKGFSSIFTRIDGLQENLRNHMDQRIKEVKDDAVAVSQSVKEQRIEDAEKVKLALDARCSDCATKKQMKELIDQGKGMWRALSPVGAMVSAAAGGLAMYIVTQIVSRIHW
jgi:anti-sigma-K factor RskA